jgi:hypothetical protein
VGNLKEREYVIDLAIDERIILNLIFKIRKGHGLN